MTSAAERPESQNRLNDTVAAVVAQQQRLLKRFDDVSHYLEGAAAGVYLPGVDKTFDNPVRKVYDLNRPLFLSLEVKRDGLVFSGAISRPKKNKLLYSVIFSYDVSFVYSPRGGGNVLPANNVVLARRANELLSALVTYGRRVSFGGQFQEALEPVRLPTPVFDRGKLVAEDYSGVLGLQTENPASQIESVTVRLPNPAEKILARRGVEYPLGLSHAELEDAVTELKAAVPDIDLDWGTAVDALLFRHPYLSFKMPREDALLYSPEAVVAKMRAKLPRRYQWEASFNDLLVAAKSPEKPLSVSRLSAVQLFPVETAFDFPEHYGGALLTPNNWAPSSIRQAVMQENA